MFFCPTDVDSSADPSAAGETGGGASTAVLDSWEDGASSTPEDGTAKPIVENDVDDEVDMDGDEEKPKPVPKKTIEQLEPKPKKEHINIVIIGHVGKTQLVAYFTSNVFGDHRSLFFLSVFSSFKCSFIKVT